jgi:hypothetical protein
VNLFLIGWSDERAVASSAAREALGALLERLPFFPGEPIRTWRAPSQRVAAAWVQHAPERVGDVQYAATRPGRLALFAGRPVLWNGDDSADGYGALDPATYLPPAEEWAHRLDGRCTVVRTDGVTVEVFSDALGAYPVYRATHDGITWVSNNAELLRAPGDDALDFDVAAALLGGGWSLSGDPIWSGVRRLARGRIHRLGADDGPELLPLTDVASMCGRGLDAGAAARTLVTGTAALADWDGRPSVVPVTGGRDSRLVLAAARAADIDFSTNTGGEPGHPDVDIGRVLADAVDADHELIADDPHGSVFSHWERAAELIAMTAAGTASLADAAGFPLGPRDGVLPLWHSGQGGEIARGYYGRAGGIKSEALVDSLYAAFVGRRPGRDAPLAHEGERLVRDQVRRWVDEMLGALADPADVPDLFYVLARMGTWAGPSHGCVEFVRDTTSPLWSVRMLPHELGLPAAERAREEFHLRVLERIAPDLVDIPFENDQPWPSRQSELQRRAGRARVFAGKVRGELKRRASQPSPGPAAEAAGDPFAAVLAGVRTTVLDQPGHPAWALLDRPRVESLLGRGAGSLDAMSRYYVWRLATVFGGLTGRRI